MAQSKDERLQETALWMNRTRELPADLCDWARNRVFRPRRFMYITVAGKRSGSCTNCGWTGPTKAKTDTQVECPGCGMEMWAKSEVRYGRFEYTDFASVIQRIEGGVMIRRFSLLYDTSFRPARVRSHEIVRTVWPDGAKKPIRYAEEWGSPDKWVWHPWHRSDYDQYLHPSAAHELIGTRWQYSGLPEAGKRVAIPVELWFKCYLKMPGLEMLAKMGMMSLAYTALCCYENPGNFASKNPETVVGLPKRYFRIVSELNLNYRQVENIAYLVRQGNEATPEDIRTLTKDGREDCFWYVSLFIQPRRYPKKLINHRVTMDYLNARKDEASLYYDYLELALELRLDLQDPDVLRPRNLKAEHDRITGLAREQRARERSEKQRADAKKYEERVREVAESNPKLEVKRAGLMSVLPKSTNELVREGEVLDHCVGSYAARVARGDCLIVFIRQDADPDKPFVTVELQNGRIAQMRGKHNAAPPPEVEKWAQSWSRSIAAGK